MTDMNQEEKQALESELLHTLEQAPHKVVNVSKFVDVLGRVADQKLGTLEAFITKREAGSSASDDKPREGLYKHPHIDGEGSLFLDTDQMKAHLGTEMHKLIEDGKIPKGYEDIPKRIAGVIADAIRETEDSTPLIKAKIIVPTWK